LPLIPQAGAVANQGEWDKKWQSRIQALIDWAEAHPFGTPVPFPCHDGQQPPSDPQTIAPDGQEQSVVDSP
jgi:hypothetical protein